MKRFIYFFIVIACVSCSKKETSKDLDQKINERLQASTTNLVPDEAGTTPSYWCTWGAQNFAVDSISVAHSIGLGDHRLTADNLTEEVVFSNPGWEKYIPQEIKKDLYVMYDVGWDVPGGSNEDKSKWVLGTMVVAVDKFPSATGTPVERLSKLNEITKNSGWKGAGLWVASQTEMDSRGKKNITEKEVEDFFRERARWSKEAGIDYWKIDYGSRGGSNEFRQMLTKVAAEEAPGLWVEHGRGSGPLNDEECPWDTPNFHRTGSYRNWDDGGALAKAVSLIQFSDVLRTYDVTSQLSIPTTLDRVAQILAEVKAPVSSKAIINCEDEPYIAASLGCAIGIMRHPLYVKVKSRKYNPTETEKAMDEMVRAIRWQRIAPAFGAGKTAVTLDPARLEDTWNFQEGDSWAAWMIGKTGMQGAPARVARGIELPEVSGSDSVPYVLASKHPNGAVSVATIKRVSGREFYYPLVDVALNIGSAKQVGIFGGYKSLRLETDGVDGKKIWAQDLAGDKAIEITDLVNIKENEILFESELLKKLGSLESTEGDISEPGFMIEIRD